MSSQQSTFCSLVLLPTKSAGSQQTPNNPSAGKLRQRLGLFILAVVSILSAGCSRNNQFPSRPLTLVCPWAAGGGTDRVSRQMAMLLERELGQPVNVINATGGKGVTGHSRGLQARPDGYTLTMMTFELNTMHWVGLTNLTYKDCEPLLSVNEDYAAIMVRKDAKWSSIPELAADIAARPGELTASGTAIGGAWHLAFAGWLNSAGMDPSIVTWIPSQGSNPSLQQLISGGIDIVCCSLPEARTLIEAGEVSALGLMAPERAFGFEDVPTLREQGQDCVLGGWRGLAAPKGTPPEIVAKLAGAVQNIVEPEPASGNFADFMQTQKFDRTWRSPKDFLAFMEQTDTRLGELLKSDAMSSVSNDRFDPMAYPYVLLSLIAISLVGLAVTSVRTRTVAQDETERHDREQQATPETEASWTSASIINIAFVLLAIASYTLLAETIGFIVLVGAIMFVLLLRFGSSPLTSLAIAAVFIPLVYFLFTVALRVPLPRGWLG